ncbi:MAG: TRAP transporter substrate-binding protein DctP [Rhizobiaceae bacterium]|nr:TRAP transporter substrate-binding protein DctP [Rhizobiaceae bacterium]
MEMHRRHLMMAGLGLAGAAVAANAARAQDGKVYTLRYQCSHPANTVFVTVTGQRFRDMVEKMSGGRIKFEVFDVGAVVGVTGMLEAVDQGVLDISQSWGGYYSGDVPEADVECGLPLAWNSPWQAYDAFYNRGLNDIMVEAYEKKFQVKYFPAIISLAYGVGTRQELKSLADLNGLKIRAIGLFGEFVKGLGAAPAVLPAPELYTALQLGTVDGVVYGAEALAGASLNDFIKTMVLNPNWNTGVGHWMINRGVWESLPPELQQVIEFASHYGNIASAMQYTVAEAATIGKLKAKGLKFLDLSEEERGKLNAAADATWKLVEAKSELAAKAVALVRQQRADFG